MNDATSPAGTGDVTGASATGSSSARLCPAAVQVEVRDWRQYLQPAGEQGMVFRQRLATSLVHDPAWLTVLKNAMGHIPYGLEATVDGKREGVLPLVLLRSSLFGRFLVSLPYLNSGGVLASRADVAASLIDRAVQLADDLRVRYLELRHESACEHPALSERLTSKIHMRLPLPATSDVLWKQFKDKVRNQVRKAEKSDFHVAWGQHELLTDFYIVFSRNMRDLGTPVYGRRLFDEILNQFRERAELCVVREGQRPIAAALLLHGRSVTEVPSAGSLKEHRSTNVNMYMYWQLLQRAIERGQSVFDFGRSTIDSPTHRFKKQWGAQPEPAVWQYYVRQGRVGDMRPDNPSYGRLIRIWQRLPVAVTRVIGPLVVRGIP